MRPSWPMHWNSEGAEPQCDHKDDGLWRLVDKRLSVDRGEKRVTWELVKSSPVGRDVRIEVSKVSDKSPETVYGKT